MLGRGPFQCELKRFHQAPVLSEEFCVAALLITTCGLVDCQIVAVVLSHARHLLGTFTVKSVPDFIDGTRKLSPSTPKCISDYRDAPLRQQFVVTWIQLDLNL